MNEPTTGRPPRHVAGRRTEGRTAETAALEGTAAEVVVVSNRQPYRHDRDDGEVVVERPTGGLTAGLDDVVRRVDGRWVAWGDGDADAAVVDEDDRVAVPPDADDQYPLRRVWLSDEQVENYYYGFSNRVLWPVCHGTLTNVRCEDDYWESYRRVNEQFAGAVAEETSAGDVVFLQDYQLALVSRAARPRLPDGVAIAQFWHVPWPAWDTFRACPHGEAVLRGLLGNDLFAVHVERYRENFLGCVDRALPEARVDRATGRIDHQGGQTRVVAEPFGVDNDRIRRLATDDDAASRWHEFRTRHEIDPATRVGLGVDRLDYSKGIARRLEALERLFEAHPEWRGRFTFVQVGSESRSRIPAYQRVQDAVAAQVAHLDERFGTADWQPVVYTTDRLSDETLYALYRAADVGVVTPLRDGMNLVAQEYVAAQADTEGVLVLSDQAGAHDRLGDAAVSVCPTDRDDVTDALHTALTMPARERRRRLSALRRACRETDVEGWIEDLLDRAASLRTVPA